MPPISEDTAAKLRTHRLCDRISAVEQLAVDLLVQLFLDRPVRETVDEIQEVVEARLLKEVERSRLIHADHSTCSDNEETKATE